MTRLCLETVIPLPREDYFQFAYTKEFDEFQAKHVNLKSVEELDFFQKDEDLMLRKIKVVPDVELPQAALWYLGQNEFHYVDEQEKDMKTFTVRFKTIPPVCQDRIDIKGEVRLEDIDGKSCKQILEVEIEVSAWGFGSLFETVLASNLEKDWSCIPKAVEAWQLYKRDPAEYMTKYADIENKTVANEETKPILAEPTQAPTPAPSQAGLMNYISSWWS